MHLLLNLHIRKIIRRQSHVHLGHLGGNHQHDQRSVIGLSRVQGSGKIPRGETLRCDRQLKGSRSNI